MPIIEQNVSFATEGNSDVIDITPLVEQKLENSPLDAGVVSLFAPGATGALTTIEFEPALVKDFQELMDRLVPENHRYAHDSAWGDGNGHSHLRASLIGPAITVPFSGKALQLGTWQQIIFVDFDTRPRNRTLVMKIIGE